MTYNGFDIERVRKEAQKEAKILFGIIVFICFMLVISGIPVLSSIAVVFLIICVPVGIWYISKKGEEAVMNLYRQQGKGAKKRKGNKAQK
jgi:Ca2+/Na+ antiporter